MPNRRFTVAMAALVLGLQLGSPAVASLRQLDLDLIVQLIAEGDVARLVALLDAYPDLLNLEGALGEALRAFRAEPSPDTLAQVAMAAGGNVGVALRSAVCDAGIACY